MRRVIFFLATTLLLASPTVAAAQDCVECHTGTTPQIVEDWRLSAHNEAEVSCSDCHGAEHTSAEDVAYKSIAVNLSDLAARAATTASSAA